LPRPLALLAVHSWFVTFDPSEGRWHRWEVYQSAGASGYINEDLWPLEALMGGGAGWIDREWHDGEAQRILAALAEAPKTYPYRDMYRAWPGPNCNTYAAWVLREAGVAADLDPRAVGKDYLGVVGADWTTTRTGIQIETPLVGLKLGVKDGIEVHFLCATFGLDAWPPAFKTPCGRIGFPE
jgi:hypothetical protein